MLRMKDSFHSFRAVHPDEWRINIRGRLKHVACDFLSSELGNCASFHFLNSQKGWLHDSYSFMQDVKSDYVLFWIEDHLCLVQPDVLGRVLKEMHSFSVDQLRYTFFLSGPHVFRHLSVVDEGVDISVYKIDEASASKARRFLGRDFYVVSAASLFQREFFLKVLRCSRPYLKRWPKHLPFDFEKKSKDQVATEIRWAMPKIELFAAIDDDHGIPGYSLISRGIYPNRLSRTEMKELEYRPANSLGRLIPLPSTVRLCLVSAYSLFNRLRYTFANFF